jgi:hypothetical protein
MSEKACEGGQTMETRHSGEHFALCAHCGSETRCDMVNHPFWGFASTCPHTRKPRAGVKAGTKQGNASPSVAHSAPESNSHTSEASR